jgi:hypothetical protein
MCLKIYRSPAGDDRPRSIRCANPAFKQRLGLVKGGPQCLFAAGFVKQVCERRENVDGFRCFEGDRRCRGDAMHNGDA